MFLSALPTLKYAMTDKEHEHILAELVAKRGNKPQDWKVLNEEDDEQAQELEQNLLNIVDEINKL